MIPSNFDILSVWCFSVVYFGKELLQHRETIYEHKSFVEFGYKV